MKAHFLRVLIVLAVLAVTAAACVVRSRPASSRHTVVHQDHGKHKKHKKHK